MSTSFALASVFGLLVVSAIDARAFGSQSASDEHFGAVTCTAGDLDLDGVDDVLVAAPLAEQACGIRSGAVVLLSGRTGARLALLRGHVERGAFGEAMASGSDVDGDGFVDFAIAAPHGDTGRGYVDVVSSRTGEVLVELSAGSDAFEFGRALAFVPDLDGDGHDDLAVSWLDAPARIWSRPTALCGHVHIFSSRSGRDLRALVEPSSSIGFGTCLARTPDLDGDRLDDLLIESVSDSEPAPGTLRAVSSRTGASLFAIEYWSSPGGPDGGSLAIGKFRGDGSINFVVADDRTSRGDWSKVLVLDRDHAEPIRSFRASTRTVFGARLAVVRDLDGDGIDELAVSNGDADGFSDDGRAWLLSGKSGAVLREFRVEGDETMRMKLGVSIAVVDDSGGRPSLALGELNYETHASAVQLRSCETGKLIWRQTYLCALEGRVQTPVRGR